MRKVTAPHLTANGLWNPFTGKKKWQIECGECQHTWTDKLPVVETCSAICPCCGAQNKWSLSKFINEYNNEMERQK